MMQENVVKRIVVEYEDGSEKVIDRGVVFSVYEEEELLKVSLDGIAGSEEDVYAVLGIISGIAKELGVPDNLAEEIV